MSLRAHESGDCWPDTCPYCQWEDDDEREETE